MEQETIAIMYIIQVCQRVYDLVEVIHNLRLHSQCYSCLGLKSSTLNKSWWKFTQNIDDQENASNEEMEEENISGLVNIKELFLVEMLVKMTLLNALVVMPAI